MLEALGTRLKSFYGAGAESHSSLTAEAAPFGVGFAQKEVVSLSNVWKEGNWAVGCFRVAFVLQSAATLLISAKNMICDAKKNGEDSVSRLNSANFKTLFGHTVVLTSNVLSLVTWANQKKLISLGQASFRTSLVTYILGNLVNYSLFLKAVAERSAQQKAVTTFNGAKDPLIWHRINAKTWNAYYYGIRMQDNMNGIVRLWKGDNYLGIKLWTRMTDILMCATGAGTFAYGLFLKYKEKNQTWQAHAASRLCAPEST